MQCHRAGRRSAVVVVDVADLRIDVDADVDVDVDIEIDSMLIYVIIVQSSTSWKRVQTERSEEIGLTIISFASNFIPRWKFVHRFHSRSFPPARARARARQQTNPFELDLTSFLLLRSRRILSKPI